MTAYRHRTTPKNPRTEKSKKAVRLAAELGVTYARARQLAYEPEYLQHLRLVKLKAEITKLELDNDAFRKKWVSKKVATANADYAASVVWGILKEALLKPLPKKLKGLSAPEMVPHIKAAVREAGEGLHQATKGGQPTGRAES